MCGVADAVQVEEQVDEGDKVVRHAHACRLHSGCAGNAGVEEHTCEPPRKLDTRGQLRDWTREHLFAERHNAHDAVHSDGVAAKEARNVFRMEEGITGPIVTLLENGGSVIYALVAEFVVVLPYTRIHEAVRSNGRIGLEL